MIHEQVHLTQDQAIDLCAEWQKVLRLEDWDVVLKVVRGNGMNLPPYVQGECSFCLTRRSAVIKLLDPIDYDKDLIHPQDMEATLVHELLHLHFGPFQPDRDTAEHVAMEQAIHHISYALVRAKRSGGSIGVPQG